MPAKTQCHFFTKQKHAGYLTPYKNFFSKWLLILLFEFQGSIVTRSPETVSRIIALVSIDVTAYSFIMSNPLFGLIHMFPVKQLSIKYWLSELLKGEKTKEVYCYFVNGYLHQ